MLQLPPLRPAKASRSCLAKVTAHCLEMFMVNLYHIPLVVTLAILAGCSGDPMPIDVNENASGQDVAQPQTSPNQIAQTDNGRVTVDYDGRQYELQAFQCLRDYASPVDPDRKVALALDAAASGLSEDLLKPLRGGPNSNASDSMEAMARVLAKGAAINIARYADGMDIVTFYPTSDLDDAVFAMSEDGFLKVSGNRIEGIVSTNSRDSTSAKEIRVTAQCP